ncbi:MAG: NEAT domain-containing protein [Clostridium perfringens]|nr:NEAT domain-containing protein [Clostridium perfringens]
MKKNTIALILAASLIGGYMPAEVFATGNSEIECFSETEDKKYANGTYTVANSALRVDSDAQSSARKYVNEESKVIISDDGIKATLEFTEKNIMTNIKVKVNGEEVSYTEKETGDKSIEVEFSLNSLEDNIEISTQINLGFHVMDVSFRVLLDTESIKPMPDNSGSVEEGEQGSENEPDNSTEDNDNSNNTSSGEETTPGDNDSNKEPDSNTPNTEDSSNNTPNSGSEPTTPGTSGSTSNDVQAPTATENTNTTIYKIKNEILSSSAIGYSAARAAVSSTSYIEVINGVTYVTLGLSQLDVMTNIKVSVDGSNVSYETVRSSSANNTKDIRFKVASESSSITLSAYITMSDMNISFGVDLLESTKEQISKTEANKSLGVSSNLAVTTPNSSSSSSSGSTSEASSKSSTTSSESNEEENGDNELEEIEATEYFKKYTIENEVISDSAIGKMMVKKYLDSTSILEDIDGKYYLTLTFVGTSAMDNIKIMVNGKEVEYSMKNISDDDKGTSTFKFGIENINDEITMSMLIVPINTTIEFGISLLEDTLTLTEEGTVSKTEVEEASMENLSLTTSTRGSGTSITKTIIISTLTTIITMSVIGGIALGFMGKRKKNLK